MINKVENLMQKTKVWLLRKKAFFKAVLEAYKAYLERSGAIKKMKKARLMRN